MVLENIRFVKNGILIKKGRDLLKWKVGCIQFNIVFGKPLENKLLVEKWLESAAKQDCDIVVLPELWTTGYDLTRLTEIADQNAQDTIAFLQEQAVKHHIHIIGGSIANAKGNNIENTMLIVSNKGELLHQYSKLHLFQLMDEHLYLQAGHNEGLFTLNNEKMAGVICYDIRFPEWIRTHVLKGAKIVFVVAEWPLKRLDHWRTLLQARAIENQVFIIACNRSGSDPNNQFAGHSMVIDPWGEILAEGGETDEIVIADIDLDRVEQTRKTIPVFQDRRPHYYTTSE